MAKTSNSRRRRSHVVAVAPYRKSTEVLPKIKRRYRNKTCFFEYGNDYDQNTGKWTLYLDIVSGNSDLVDYVGVKFSSGEAYNIRNRYPVQLSDGLEVRRFALRRSKFPECKRLTFTLFGRGGSRHTSGFRAQPENVRERAIQFLEWRRIRSYYVPPPETSFGIELEMSLDGFTTRQDIVNSIKQHADVPAKDEIDYREGKKDYHGWKLVPDGSTSCSRFNPNCNKFELVSPILKGEGGLDECEKVLQAIKNLGAISVNKSMGFHVHVDVGDLTLEQRKNVCLNFIKYEEEVDSFMPPSRRNGNEFCKSNRSCIPQVGNGRKHNAIASCQSLYELCDLMNPKQERYYKLNLQNLRTGRQETMEFRQHSSTSSFEKIDAWVRLCTRLVHNSKIRPQSLKPLDNAFELLFDTVIQDIKLKDFYRQRKAKISEEENEHEGGISLDKSKANPLGAPSDRGDCCRGCEEGHTCESSTVTSGFVF